MTGWLSKFKRDRGGTVSTTLALGEDFRFDPIADDFIADPHPILSFLRETQPIHRSRSGAWVLSRYEDVAAALRNPALGNAPSPHAVVNVRNREKYVCAQVANNILPFLDPPHHTEKRLLIGRSYFRKLRNEQASPPGFDIESIAYDTLEPLLGEGQFDVIHDFGTSFSGGVICRFMGLPIRDLPKLAKWAEYFLYLFTMMPSEQVRDRVDEALLEFRQYFQELVAIRRVDPANDWISALVSENQQAGEPLTETELVDTFMLFFADGIENVDRALGTAVKLLLEHPEQYEALKVDPSRAHQAVEECLRFESPAFMIGRVATEGVAIGDVDITAHSAVLLMLGSANRDSRQFEDADQFSCFKKREGVLTFGKGAHACVGKQFVEQQLEAALKMLISECPDITLATDNFRWEKRIGHRWLTHCPVRV